VVSTTGVDHYDEAAAVIRPYRDEALLTDGPGVLDRHGSRVVEHCLRVREADTMLAEVRVGLGWIPSDIHGSLYAYGVHTSSAQPGGMPDGEGGGHGEIVGGKGASYGDRS
jgi:hypothetical protein